ncbi:VOC family protein [Chthonobacter rhizosphaerae]|uniref:VOC family protein n=1 Tax=Chthonobacter rhizosphaerae TaxID=2735553 RepID=UPI0015EF4C0B|nr:VOC family protein [Chthonobacter rhizosphaerae]
MPSPPVAGLTDVCLLVEDMDRSVAFYRDRLGFAVKRLDTGFAEFFTDGVVLALWLRSDIAAYVPGLSATGGPSSVMVAVRLPDVASVDAEYVRLSAAGVAFYGPPKAWPWNAYAAYFTDPDGHLWELYHWMGPPRVIDGSPAGGADGAG